MIRSERPLAFVLTRISEETLEKSSGVMLALTIALASSFVAERYGGPVMLFALLFGIAFNFLGKDEKCRPGVDISAKLVLRLGVALLGAKISLGQVFALGAPTAMLVAAGVVFTIGAGWIVGRLFRLGSDHALLSAGAVAICGASAALAIASVLPKHEQSERHALFTVVGVTTLSTVAMVLYPMLAQVAGLDHRQAGVFLGGSIHDVAQVVGAGYMISPETGDTAAIVKLMRVALLAPAVMMIAFLFRVPAENAGAARFVPIPAFLAGFLALMTINSAGWAPAPAMAVLSEASRWCLLIAVAALGVKTSLKDIFAIGLRPVGALFAQTLLLAAFLLAGLRLIAAYAT